MRWPNVQSTDVKLSQDLTHLKSLKAVNFGESYLKNKKVDVFLGHSVDMTCGCNCCCFLLCKNLLAVRYSFLVLAKGFAGYWHHSSGWLGSLACENLTVLLLLLLLCLCLCTCVFRRSLAVTWCA